MRWFLDTNVLVYGIAGQGDERRRMAGRIIETLARSGNGVLSTQVLSEFSRVCLAKAPHISAHRVSEHVIAFDDRFRIVPLTLSVVLEAIRGATHHSLSFFDAQIWAAARLNQVTGVLSEDFQDGQVLEGVRFVNPFGTEFDVEMLG